MEIEKTVEPISPVSYPEPAEVVPPSPAPAAEASLPAEDPIRPADEGLGTVVDVLA